MVLLVCIASFLVNLAPMYIFVDQNNGVSLSGEFYTYLLPVVLVSMSTIVMGLVSQNGLYV